MAFLTSYTAPAIWGTDPNATAGIAPKTCFYLLGFALHLVCVVTECRCAGDVCRTRHKFQWIRMGLPAVHLRLSSSETNVLSIIREFDPHLLAYALEHLRDPLKLHGVRIPNRKHRVFMTLLGTDRHRATVRPRPNHLQGEIGIVAMDADKNTGFDLVAPDRQIRMVRIDDFFRVNFGILGSVIRHGNDHDIGNLCSDFKKSLGLFHGMIVPGPENHRPREKRRIRAR